MNRNRFRRREATKGLVNNDGNSKADHKPRRKNHTDVQLLRVRSAASRTHLGREKKKNLALACRNSPPMKKIKLEKKRESSRGDILTDVTHADLQKNVTIR